MDDLEDSDYYYRTAADCLFEILNTKNWSNASCEEFESLLKRFPEAAQVLQPDQGCPRFLLHMACLGDTPICLIHALLKAWPGAVRTMPWCQWRDGPLPLHDACAHAKSLPTIQLLVEAWPDSLNKSVQGRATV